MNDFAGAQEWVPPTADLRVLGRAVQDCHGCDLYRDSTQAVFGEGPGSARVALVGEQPGDQEDKAGRPFVGPAGRILDRALADAGIDRGDAYVTNAVKHFRYERRGEGKRRLHKKPGVAHILACQPWLNAELAAVQPQVVVVLGAVAARALLGASYRVTKQRGEPVELPGGGIAVGTVHPSSVLRADDREAAYAGLVADLRKVAELLTTDTAGPEHKAKAGQSRTGRKRWVSTTS
jgi:uracil-DNA glycosylase